MPGHLATSGTVPSSQKSTHASGCAVSFIRISLPESEPRAAHVMPPASATHMSLGPIVLPTSNFRRKFAIPSSHLKPDNVVNGIQGKSSVGAWRCLLAHTTETEASPPYVGGVCSNREPSTCIKVRAAFPATGTATVAGCRLPRRGWASSIDDQPS